MKSKSASKSVCVSFLFNGLLNPSNILSIIYILCYFFYSHNKDPLKRVNKKKTVMKTHAFLLCEKIQIERLEQKKRRKKLNTEKFVRVLCENKCESRECG